MFYSFSLVLIVPVVSNFWHIRNALSELPKIYLSVNRKEKFEGAGLHLTVDEFEAIGPMGGICSWLRKCQEDALLVTASDMPFVSKEIVAQLLHQYEEKQVLTVVVADGRAQPLLGVYPKRILPVLEGLISEGDYRLCQVIELVDHVLVELPEGNLSTQNINTPDEYAAIRQSDSKETMR